MVRLLLVLLLVLYVSAGEGSCGTDCQGYDNDVAKAAVHFAACSCVTPEHYASVREWTWNECLLAQGNEGFMKQKELVIDEKNYMLALLAYDAEK